MVLHDADDDALVANRSLALIPPSMNSGCGHRFAPLLGQPMLGCLAIRLHPMDRRVAERERMFDELRVSVRAERSYRRTSTPSACQRLVPGRRNEALGRVEPRRHLVAPGRHPAVVANADDRAHGPVDDRHAARRVLEDVALLLAVEKRRERYGRARWDRRRARRSTLRAASALTSRGRSSALRNASIGGRTGSAPDTPASGSSAASCRSRPRRLTSASLACWGPTSRAW